MEDQAQGKKEYKEDLPAKPSTLLVVDLADMGWVQPGSCRPALPQSTSTAEGGLSVQVVSRSRDLADLGFGAWVPTELPLFDAPYFLTGHTTTGPVVEDGKRSAVAPPNVVNQALAALRRHRQQTGPLVRTEEHGERAGKDEEAEEEEAKPPCAKKRRRGEPKYAEQEQQQIHAPRPQGPTTTTPTPSRTCPPVETLPAALVNANTSHAPAPPFGSSSSSSSSSSWPSLKAQVKADGEALVAWVALGESLQRFRQASAIDDEPPSVDARAVTGADAMMGRLVRNDRDGETLLTAFPDRTFVVPARSAFLLSDVKSMLPPLLRGNNSLGHDHSHVDDDDDDDDQHFQRHPDDQHETIAEEEEEEEEEGGFNLVVMDPPWENRSLARSGNYGTLAPHEIAKLPLRQLLSPRGAYVVVWVTNNPALHNFVRRNLFPRWHLQFVATHYWLKLTSAGEPVMPVHSAHRKPYEPFMVGYYDGTQGMRHRSHEPAVASTPPPPQELFPLMQLREQMVVCSTANRHARKPCLDDVLGLQPRFGLKKLELFARNLRAGWTSWGAAAANITDNFTREPPPLRP